MNALGRSAARLMVAGLLIAFGPLPTVLPATAGPAKGDYFDAERFVLREALAPVQTALRDEHPDEFGGLWIDDAGTPHVAIVGDAPGVLATLKGVSLPRDVVLHSVVRSERELDAAMAAISAAIKDRREGGIWNLDLEGAKISSIELSIQSNAIVFHDTASTGIQRAAIAADFGSAVVFDGSERHIDDVACTGRTNCGNPIRAGLQLYKWIQNGGYPVPACMSAFVIKDEVLPPHYFGTSAGHCFDSNSTGRYHPAGTYLGSGSSSMKVYYNGADVMRFTISATQASNLLYITSSTMRSVTSTESTEVIGQQVCSSKLSGVDCGQLQSRNVCSDGGAICGLRLASYQYACTGDSGSPVYMPTGSTTARAQGIIQGKSSGTYTCPNDSRDHMGSSSVYSWINNDLAAMGRFMVVTSAP